MADGMITPMRAPDAEARARIAAEARKGSDTALPARDRRNRPRISARTDLAPWTIVNIDGPKEVIGPGRGDGWMLLAWVDDELGGIECYGTFHESQLPPERAPDAAGGR